MAYKIAGSCYLDAGEFCERNCIWCNEICETTQLLDTGEAIEMWCYCAKCDSECWHPIKKINEGTVSGGDTCISLENSC